jgi:hypothetical protein
MGNVLLVRALKPPSVTSIDTGTLNILLGISDMFTKILTAIQEKLQTYWTTTNARSGVHQM